MTKNVQKTAKVQRKHHNLIKLQENFSIHQKKNGPKALPYRKFR